MVASVFRAGLFDSQVALVTGGGTGIGLRTARELAQLGATVVLAGRRGEVVEGGAQQIVRDGGKAHAFACDVREEGQVTRLIEGILQRCGGLNLVINNAGGQFPSPAEAISNKGWNSVIATNLTGPFLVAQSAFQQVLKERGGAIVNVVANFWRGFPYMAHTGAARAAVSNLTMTLATEWGRYGVRVNAVAPGTIHSSGLDRYAPEFRGQALAQGKNNQAARLGTEAEVASAIVFLLSPGARYVTGTTLAVDAGESLYHPLLPPVAHNRLPPFADPSE